MAARTEFRNLGRLVTAGCVRPVERAGAAPAVDDSNKHPHRGVHAQLPAAEFIARMYPHATSAGVAIAVVPDPLVPRYRRLYDLSIKAIELGMLKDNYVLDRYSFPWSEELQADSALVGPAPAPAPVSTSGPAQPDPAMPANDAISQRLWLDGFSLRRLARRCLRIPGADELRRTGRAIGR